MIDNAIGRGWRAQLRPNREQARLLDLWANHTRGVWNRLLGAVVARYEADGTFLWKRDLQKLVVVWKHEPDTAWMAELPAHALLEVCNRLDKALRRMLSERKAGRMCGFPRFRKKRWGEGGVYFVNQTTRLAPDGRSARLPKLGLVKLRGGALPPGRLLGSRAMRDGDGWALAAQLECPRPAPLPATNVRLGIDSGLHNQVTTFDGEAFDTVKPPKPLHKALRRLRRAQRKLSRRKKGSARRQAQVKRVAELHRKVRCQRADFTHKLSHQLIAKADALVVETLDIRAMATNRRLGRLVADVAMGTLLRQLAYKADWRGRSLLEADRYFPSTRMCCGSGALNDVPLGNRRMACGCGNTMDRDENAAVNLYWYPEEPGNRGGDAPTRGKIGRQVAGASLRPVPVAEPRMLASVA